MTTIETRSGLTLTETRKTGQYKIVDAFGTLLGLAKQNKKDKFFTFKRFYGSSVYELKNVTLQGAVDWVDSDLEARGM